MKNVNVNVIQCKECKYFEKNSWTNFDGIPLIVAHEVCKFWGNGWFWGNGCKNNPEGYCSAAELGKDIAESLEYSLDGGIEEFSREGR